MSKAPKRPCDPNPLAKFVIDTAIGEEMDGPYKKQVEDYLIAK